MSIDLEIQIASNTKTLPHPSQFREWISVTLWDRLDNIELTIRIVDEEESAALNKQYRNKNMPTNVLAFPYSTPDDVESHILGDIVVCAPVIEQQAREHNKELLSHWAHMIIHGALHLLGFNHENTIEAEEMEGLETEIMVKLGYAPPYGEFVA